MKPTPKCPACGRRGEPVGSCGDMFRCKYCNCFYDADPNEGGDYHADPSRRMERSEQRAIRARRGPK